MDWNHGFCNAGCLRQAKTFWRASHCVKNLKDTAAKKEGHTPGFVLGSLCLGTCLLIFCDGSALRPCGRWARETENGKAPKLACEMSVFQRIYSPAQRQIVHDPTFHHPSFSVEPDLSSGLRRFFLGNPAQCLSPKEDRIQVSLCLNFVNSRHSILYHPTVHKE